MRGRFPIRQSISRSKNLRVANGTHKAGLNRVHFSYG
jgi:hypothetical protein